MNYVHCVTPLYSMGTASKVEGSHAMNIIHITGASGSGTSTLGRAIEERFGHKWLDTDDYFWLPTDPPYAEQRLVEERVKLIEQDIEKYPRCAISGSLCNWGNPLIPRFDLVVFLYASTDIRIERLIKREYENFGERTLEGGDMYENHVEFIDWARNYDVFDISRRSLARHEEWLKLMLCPVLRLDGTRVVDELVGEIAHVF